MSKVDRLEHTLARELSGAIRELQDPRIPLVVTVERVKLSPDGRQARVLVSALSPDDAEGMLAALNGAAGYLQQAVARDLALKFTPKLHFYGDALEVL
jgi:ribosome-binding factor A